MGAKNSLVSSIWACSRHQVNNRTLPARSMLSKQGLVQLHSLGKARRHRDDGIDGRVCMKEAEIFCWPRRA